MLFSCLSEFFEDIYSCLKVYKTAVYLRKRLQKRKLSFTTCTCHFKQHRSIDLLFKLNVFFVYHHVDSSSGNVWISRRFVAVLTGCLSTQANVKLFWIASRDCTWTHHMVRNICFSLSVCLQTFLAFQVCRSCRRSAAQLNWMKWW